ncbi:unnamed protein product [Durusdinium trenchii]|uniref:Uncharacterized protein n=1 Tax=Durusdinium trenchii TaxID=1381693 RepID=A0ABP0H7Z8_9DINO
MMRHSLCLSTSFWKGFGVLERNGLCVCLIAQGPPVAEQCVLRLLRTAGFSRLDTRVSQRHYPQLILVRLEHHPMGRPNQAGSCAMDLHQAEECMLPADGFVLMNEKASIAALDFVRQVEEDMDLQWKESKESESWRSKLAFLKPPTGMVVDELREMKEKVSRENAEARLSQDAKDAKRREAQLESLGEKSSTGLLPRRFAAACMVRFRLVFGPYRKCESDTFYICVGGLSTGTATFAISQNIKVCSHPCQHWSQGA